VVYRHVHSLRHEMWATTAFHDHFDMSIDPQVSREMRGTQMDSSRHIFL